MKRVPLFFAHVSDLIIGSRGMIDESRLLDAQDAHDTHLVRADSVLRIGTFENVSMVATHPHGEMPFEEELLGHSPLFGYDTCETYGQCNSTADRPMYVGSRCSHGGLEGLCYLSSARTLECGRVTDVHRRPGTAARAAVLARASMAALYASGASVQTLEHIRPCPWGTPLVRGGATGTRVFAKRWLLAGCMAPADAHYEVTAEVHLPQACALPRHHLPGCLFPGALNYDPSAKESAFCRYATRGCMDASALNYNAFATADDGSCIAPVRGCTLDAAITTAAAASSSTSSNTTYSVDGARSSDGGGGSGGGCADAASTGWMVDGTPATCSELPPYCNDPTYGAQIREACPVSCGACSPHLPPTPPPPLAPPGVGGGVAAVVRFDAAANVLDGCVVAIEGCMEPTAANYEPNATINEATWCVPALPGCMAPRNRRYDAAATVHDPSYCARGRRGCMSSTAINYDPAAEQPTACYEYVPGCLSLAALNFGCGLAHAHATSPCRSALGWEVSRSDMYSTANNASATLVTVHMDVACNYDAVGRASTSLAGSGASPGFETPRLGIDFLGEGDVASVSTATRSALRSRFAQLTPTPSDPSRVGLALSAASVRFSINIELRSAAELALVQSALEGHTSDLDAFNSFLEGTGAPPMLMLPRLNVTWLAGAAPADAHALTAGATIGISTGAIAIAIAIGLGVAYLHWRRKQSRAEGGGSEASAPAPAVAAAAASVGSWLPRLARLARVPFVRVLPRHPSRHPAKTSCTSSNVGASAGETL